MGHRNKEELREKARERMARQRNLAREDPELATQTAARRRTHDATYRKKHHKVIMLKSFLRRDEAHYRQYRRHLPTPEARDYQQELDFLKEDAWAEKMPPHLRKRRQQAGEM
ncbi:hypothetical protein C8F04DRAFT_1259492 [Mycena alexandri]|uniref:Uncharacterized protein n=1 Tax=Mycena alexandri TaxID=1745969 RepID=A0AAD6SVX0_9AGAR|nr:hypothetical protein C8F04DRAFT_1259492 [Mycena alexandri]